MKTLLILKKAIVEQIRDYWGLLLTLITAPFFVTIYWLMFSGSSSSYSILVINNDQGANGQEVVKSLTEMKYEDGQPILIVRELKSEVEGKKILTNKEAAALFIIPDDFSQILDRKIKGEDTLSPKVKMVGNMINSLYPVASIMTMSAVENFIISMTNGTRHYIFTEEFVGDDILKRTDFDLSIPGLLIFSIVMLIYSSAMAVTREVEDKTLKRLFLSPITSFEYLSGICLSQILLGILSIVLTFYTALLFGFQSSGSILSAIVVAILSIISIVAISLIVVSFCKTTSNVIIIGTFPLFLLMFLTGSMMPLPQAELFRIAGRTISYNFILPPTHAVNAFNKIFISGAGVTDILFEITAIIILTLFYFTIGILLFTKKHTKGA